MTAHPPRGKTPATYQVVPVGPERGTFAWNNLWHDALTNAANHKYYYKYLPITRKLLHLEFIKTRFRMKKALLLLGAIAVFGSSCQDVGTSDNTGGTASSKDSEGAIVRPKAPVAQGKPRILFVGNSHTEYYISLPTVFGELCEANNQPMSVDKLVTMGVDISDIYNDHKAEAEKNFAKADTDGNYYDYVLLQEQTPVALEEVDKYKAQVKMMAEKIRKNSPGAAIYIYEGMSPVPYEGDGEEFNQYHEEMRKNALAVMQESGNAGLFRLGDAIKDAYEGKEGYKHEINGKDNLRFGHNSLHILNDGGFTAAVLLYATIFDKAPQIPEQLTLSTGIGDDDGMKKMPVAQAVSNPKALAAIALNNK
ncbi:hypothetical protein IC235_12725 [Hymenobacter sp. BT664]|uniref:Uncharacterized protein n=1 Tax=Hymenobacter montanus TaxID=2771359 RepID=A0A927BE70_9BACT|nr:hypothetical protein [Hymenobacter montanus]MBD2768751.1 hypothetical protein [Hymenobacter montanus]